MLASFYLGTEFAQLIGELVLGVLDFERINVYFVRLIVVQVPSSKSPTFKRVYHDN